MILSRYPKTAEEMRKLPVNQLRKLAGTLEALREGNPPDQLTNGEIDTFTAIMDTFTTEDK